MCTSEYITFMILYFQQAASNKPYWTLRLVSEQREADILEVKKDTQRADEIKAMKQAWETAEPGRAIKVYQSAIFAVMFFHKFQELLWW